MTATAQPWVYLNQVLAFPLPLIEDFTGRSPKMQIFAALARSESVTEPQPSLNLHVRPRTVDRLALDWLFDIKGSSLSERVLARLIQSEAHEALPYFKDDYRQAFITVNLAAKGNTEPFVVASYTMYGIHPDKVWPQIIAKRKVLLGREYPDFFDASGMSKPDVPKKESVNVMAVSSERKMG